MSKKYLLLTASYWWWHNSAKDWLKNYLESQWHQVMVFDIVEYIRYSKSTQFFYQIFAEKIPVIWEIIFKTFNTKILNVFLKYSMRFQFSKKFNKQLSQYEPDVVIASYFAYQYLVWDYVEKNGKNFVFWVFVTDNFVSIPWYYDDKYIDKFFVIDSITKANFSKYLVDRSDDIVDTFFPIDSKYFVDKSRLDNKNITLLLSGFKDDFTIKLLEKISEKDFYDKVTIIKWRNNHLYKKLKSHFSNKKFVFTEYVDLKNELKDIDICITKPGWALVCECIAQDVFVISPFFIKWQEKWNIDLLENYNLWFYSNDVNRIVDFLESGYMEVDMKNFARVKKSESVRIIVESL